MKKPEVEADLRIAVVVVTVVVVTTLTCISKNVTLMDERKDENHRYLHSKKSILVSDK